MGCLLPLFVAKLNRLKIVEESTVNICESPTSLCPERAGLIRLRPIKVQPR